MSLSDRQRRQDAPHPTCKRTEMFQDATLKKYNFSNLHLTLSDRRGGAKMHRIRLANLPTNVSRSKFRKIRFFKVAFCHFPIGRGVMMRRIRAVNLPKNVFRSNFTKIRFFKVAFCHFPIGGGAMMRRIRPVNLPKNVFQIQL